MSTSQAKVIEQEALPVASTGHPADPLPAQPVAPYVQPQAHLPAVATNSADSIMNLIAQAATDPNMDVTKLEKLMDLQTRLLDREAKEAFDRDYVLMKPHLPIVARRKKNTQTNSNYAPLEDINREVDPILARYGFGTSTRIVKQTETHVTVEAILRHRGGHSITNEITMPLDDKGIAGKVNKTEVHAIASTVTYCKRVAVCALLNISTGDDMDGNKPNGKEEIGPVYITDDEAIQIDKDLKETGIDRDEFFKWAKTVDDDGEPVNDSRRILAKNLKKVQGVIADRKKENAKKGEK